MPIIKDFEAVRISDRSFPTVVHVKKMPYKVRITVCPETEPGYFCDLTKEDALILSKRIKQYAKSIKAGEKSDE